MTSHQSHAQSKKLVTVFCLSVEFSVVEIHVSIFPLPPMFLKGSVSLLLVVSASVCSAQVREKDVADPLAHFSAQACLFSEATFDPFHATGFHLCPDSRGLGFVGYSMLGQGPQRLRFMRRHQ
jgi:hypothetical protein